VNKFFQTLLRQFFLFLILPIFIFSSSGHYYHTIFLDKKNPFFRESLVSLPFLPSYPVRTSTTPLSNLTAKSVFIFDLDSKVQLFEKNSQNKLPPASLTKLMTALVVLENCNVNSVVTVGKVAKNGSVMGLLEGEKITVEALLYGLLLPSGNDAAYELAKSCLGSVEYFVYSMNNKAQNLGMKDTHFTNPAGFDDPNHYSSAQDLAILAQESLKNETISKIIKTRVINVTDISGRIEHKLVNLNELLNNPEVLGIKTGKTEASGENLILARRKNGHTIVVIILGSQNRFAEGKIISDWVFNNFKWLNF